jgi:CP family cyanate transporter-like MFS transporter
LVTLFLSLTSLIFYSQLAWLAPAYRALGWSAEGAGLLLSLFTFAQVVAGLVVPWLADRTVERRPWFALVVGCVVIATAALLLWPETLPWVFVAVLGVGNAGAFSLGLLLLVDHSPDPATSGRLAAMAFLVSYGAAALGPPLLGGLRDATGSFTAGWLLLLVLSLAQLAVVSQFSPARRRRGV